jgi:hypothetical protein
MVAGVSTKKMTVGSVARHDCRRLSQQNSLSVANGGVEALSSEYSAHFRDFWIIV